MRYMEISDQQLKLLRVTQDRKIFLFTRYAILKYYKNDNFSIRVYLLNIYTLYFQ